MIVGTSSSMRFSSTSATVSMSYDVINAMHTIHHIHTCLHTDIGASAVIGGTRAGSASYQQRHHHRDGIRFTHLIVQHKLGI
jgi:hypothetical protein